MICYSRTTSGYSRNAASFGQIISYMIGNIHCEVITRVTPFYIKVLPFSLGNLVLRNDLKDSCLATSKIQVKMEIVSGQYQYTSYLPFLELQFLGQQ